MPSSIDHGEVIDRFHDLRLNEYIERGNEVIYVKDSQHAAQIPDIFNESLRALESSKRVSEVTVFGVCLHFARPRSA